MLGCLLCSARMGASMLDGSSACLQVRWHSFQFLLEELSEELEEMHAIMGDMLSKLPSPFYLSD